MSQLFDSLDGLYAYDQGCVDSGISDPILKQKVKKELEKELNKPENMNRLYPKFIDEFCYEYFLSQQARDGGYGVEDIKAFLEWFDNLLDRSV